MANVTPHSIDRILDAVRSVAEQLGVEKLSFRRIAKEASMSPGTLTYYFDSKDSLLEALLDGHHQHVSRVLQLIGSGASDWRNEVVGLVRYAFANRIDVRLRLATWVHRWSLPRTRRILVARTVKRAASRSWANEWSERERRVVIFLLVFAVQHFAALSDEELTALVGEPDADAAKEQVTLVVDQVITMLTQSPVPGAVTQ